MDATVLVVDDSAEFTELLQTYLEQHGYKVVTASGGQEAINHFLFKKLGRIVYDMSVVGSTC